MKKITGGLIILAGLFLGSFCLAANLGDTWIKTGNLDGATTVYCLAQASDGSIYAGTYPDGDVYKSIDDGLTWANTANLDSATGVHSLMIDANGAIYAGTSPYSDLFKSTDSGTSWLKIKTFNGSNIFKIIQTTDGKIFVATDKNGNVYVSSDLGASFVDTGDLGGAENVYTIIQTQSGSLYAGTYPDGRVFRSSDLGGSWSRTGVLTGASYVDSLLETAAGVLYAGARGDSVGRVYKSVDDGIAWGVTDKLGKAWIVEHLVQLPLGSVFAATASSGDVFKTLNSGQGWLDTGILSGVSWAYNLLFTANGSLLAATNNGVFRSIGDQQTGTDKKEEENIDKDKLREIDQNQPLRGKDVVVIFKEMPDNPGKYYFRLKKINKRPKNLSSTKTLPYFWRLKTNLRSNFKFKIKLKYKNSEIKLLDGLDSLKNKKKKLKIFFAKKNKNKWVILKNVKHKKSKQRLMATFTYLKNTKNFFAVGLR